jgi:hypothetical protein
MQVSFPKAHGTPAYQVEFRPNGYHIDGKRVKRVSTVKSKFPDSGEGLLDWAKERVAITAGRLLRDRVRKHPGTGNNFCYFPAEQIALITETALRNPDDIKDETADTGTAVHAFVEEWLLAGATEEARAQICKNYCLPDNPQLLEILQAQTDTKEMTDAERNLFYDKMKSYMFNRFCTFWLKSGLTYVGSEIVVGSRKYKFGGRIDILARDKKGRLILVDFKTSKHVAPDMFMQVAMYKLAYEEMYGEKIYKCAIIQCPREWTERNQGFGVYNFKPAKYRAIALFLLRYWNDTEFTAADCRKDCLA